MNEHNGFNGDLERWDDEGGGNEERLAGLKKRADELEDELQRRLAAPVELTAELVTDPVLGDMRDILMLQTALLMRLYDVNMRLLAEVNEDVASALWDKHEKGGHENPPTMVPQFGVKNEDSEA